MKQCLFVSSICLSLILKSWYWIFFSDTLLEITCSCLLPVTKISLTCLSSSSQILDVGSGLVYVLRVFFFMVYDFSAFFSCAPWWTDTTELSQCFLVLLFILKYISFYFEIMKIRVCFSYLAVEGGCSLPRVYARVSVCDVPVPSARSLRYRPAPSPHTSPSLLVPVPSRVVSTQEQFRSGLALCSLLFVFSCRSYIFCTSSSLSALCLVGVFQNSRLFLAPFSFIF